VRPQSAIRRVCARRSLANVQSVTSQRSQHLIWARAPIYSKTYISLLAGAINFVVEQCQLPSLGATLRSSHPPEVGRFCAHSGSVYTATGRPVKLLFVRHPSSFFSWRKGTGRVRGTSMRLRGERASPQRLTLPRSRREAACACNVPTAKLKKPLPSNARKPRPRSAGNASIALEERFSAHGKQCRRLC
jgi:hypothetical protein